MADPRFYDNRGPFRLSQLCALAGLDMPPGADGGARILDIAGLLQAGPPHLSFYDGRRDKESFVSSKGGWCLVGKKPQERFPHQTVLVPCSFVNHAFAAIAQAFYPEHELDIQAQDAAIDPTAK